MEFFFKLQRSSRQWNVIRIRCLNLGYHVVPYHLQNSILYPDWFQTILSNHIRQNVRVNQERTTLVTILRGHQIEYFFKENALYVNNEELSETDRRREEARVNIKKKERERKIRKLRFVHERDSAIDFKNNFIDAFKESKPETAKLYLLNFVKQEHIGHFTRIITNGTLDQALSEFVTYYHRDQEARLNQLRFTPFENDVKKFVNRRLDYQQEVNGELPFKFRLRLFINDLPDEFKSMFTEDQLPDLVLNTKERIIQHISFKLDERALNQQQPNVNRSNEVVNNELDQFQRLTNLAREHNRPQRTSI